MDEPGGENHIREAPMSTDLLSEQAEIVNEFLSVIHEDRRKGELKEHIRFMLDISNQEEIESMVRMEVAEQIMKS